MNPSTRWLLALGVITAGLWIALANRPTLSALTQIDLLVLRAVSRLRADPLVSMARVIVRTAWPVRILAWATIVVLIAFRRFQHLAGYLVVLLVATLIDATVAQAIGRMRPTGVAILGPWDGYAHPARPLAALALVLTGALYTLVPRGRWWRRAAATAAVLIALVCAARLYLAVDHPTDQIAALFVGGALPILAYQIGLPPEAFPVSYRRGTRAHLDVSGARGEAICQALDQQLGLDVSSIEPFGLEGSAGSTPLRLEVRRSGDVEDTIVFGKLYTRVHLRSDRWYKLSRTIMYGRLEDEKPFSSVRRLVEYEDHLLRLLRDAGLPTPRPLGFVEITPEREYVILMEFFVGAEPLSRAPVGVEVIDSCLAIVRRLWDAGVAHRDIKPSNVLAKDGQGFLIDVAFGTVRPTPWRQAVDLANMMLTLALRSTPELVYERALRLFAPDDLAEAFAASRSVTLPNQLRNRLRADHRDLMTTFRRLVPEHPPVPVQLWSVRRAALTVAVLAGVVVMVPLVGIYARASGLL